MWMQPTVTTSASNWLVALLAWFQCHVHGMFNRNRCFRQIITSICLCSWFTQFHTAKLYAKKWPNILCHIKCIGANYHLTNKTYQVYLGVWQERDVAVKLSKQRPTSYRAERQFHAKVAQLYGISHPNIVKFYGACFWKVLSFLTNHQKNRWPQSEYLYCIWSHRGNNCWLWIKCCRIGWSETTFYFEIRFWIKKFTEVKVLQTPSVIL